MVWGWGWGWVFRVFEEVDWVLTWSVVGVYVLVHVEQRVPINDESRLEALGILRSALYVFIYSFSSLSDDRSKASSKASSPHSAI